MRRSVRNRGSLDSVEREAEAEVIITETSVGVGWKAILAEMCDALRGCVQALEMVLMNG